MRANHEVRIYFATSIVRRPRNLWSLVRIARKAPKLAYAAFLVWVLGRVVGDEFSHVYVACEQGAVLDPSVIHGDRFWAEIPWVIGHPTLQWLVRVPVDSALDLDAHKSTKQKTPIRALLRYWTGGVVASRDCVSTAVGVLRSKGLDIPRQVVTPGHLWDWLRREGYEFVCLEAY